MSNNTPQKQYYASFKGKVVELRQIDQCLVRKFIMNADVVNAQVTGIGKDSQVAIVTKDGRCYIYKSDGTIISKR